MAMSPLEQAAADAVIAKMLEERNAMLVSDDEAAIRAFMAKYEIPAPDSELALWAGYHKARCLWVLCPPDKRAASEAWLTEHGMKIPEGK